MENTNHYQFVEISKGLVHVKLIGFWDDNTVEKIGQTFSAKFNSSTDKQEGQKFIVIADLSEFMPNSEKIHHVIAGCMKYANEHGLYKSIEILPTAIQRLGIGSAVKKSGKSDFRVVVQSVEEAKKMFAKLKTEIV